MVSHFYPKVERSTKFCYVTLLKPSSWPGTCWNLYPTASLAHLDQVKMEIRLLEVSA